MKYLHSLWLSQVKEQPSAIAIEDMTGIYSYNQLSETSFLWSHYLKEMGLGHGDRLVLVGDASFASIAILIGCSILGVIFTVISPEVPLARREAIINDLEASQVVVDTLSMDLIDQSIKTDGVFKRFIVQNNIAPQKELDAPPSRQLTLDPAYIVFTSGSTGRPKGIVMSHQAIVSFWCGLIDDFQLGRSKRYASLSPLQFDFSLLDIGLCLGSGSTIVFPNRALLRKPEVFVDHIADLQVTHFSGVPTIWKMILQSASRSIYKLSTLERIVFAGEHFPGEHMCAINDVLKKVDFYNIYGQSESIACTFQVLSPEYFRSNRSHMPVGLGHRDMEMFLISEEGDLITQNNMPGELHLRGQTLFSGYWKLPELSASRLIQNPKHNSYSDIVFRSGDICYFDEEGLYYFIGRKDNQIKVNGNRVELEEIETALNRFPDVTNSCVLAINNGQGNDLHAALVIKKSTKEDLCGYESLLRSFLTANLPSYMLPKHYHFLQIIPISENGKNNRQQLAMTLGLASI